MNGSTIAAVGSPGRIHSSSDTGKTWSVRSNGSAATFSGISYSRSEQGIIVAVGRDFKANPDDQIIIYSSTNGGATWEKRLYPGQQILTNVDCNDGLCIAVGDSGTILRSVDDGVTWTECVSGVKSYLNGVNVINRHNAVAVGRGGTVMRTTDGGEHWITQHQSSDYSLFSVSFADSLTGLSVGNPPKLLTTTDGGATWDSIPTYFTSMLEVQMHDRQTATRRGVTEVARTNDGGKTWGPLPLPAGVVPFRMSFWNARYGVVAPDAGGTLYYTNDSGQTWSAEESGLSVLSGAAFRMYGVSMIDSLRAVVAGPNGAIVRFTKSLLSSSVENEYPWQQQLYCYPNPTTGTTILRLPMSQGATVALFDALGKEIGADCWRQQLNSNRLPAKVVNLGYEQVRTDQRPQG